MNVPRTSAEAAWALVEAQMAAPIGRLRSVPGLKVRRLTFAQEDGGVLEVWVLRQLVAYALLTRSELGSYHTEVYINSIAVDSLAPEPRNTCNRHTDCREADEQARARGELGGATHCHNETCEDCFGT